MSRRWTTEVSLLAVAVIGATSIARLTTGSTTWRAALVTAVVGEAIVAVSSMRLSAPWSLFTGIVGVALTATWVSVPGATWYGLPTATTLRKLHHALMSVGSIHVPLTSGPGVVLLCALVAGVAAALTRGLPGTLGLMPVTALVAASTVALASGGAALLAVLLAAAGATALVSRAPEREGWRLGTVTTLAAAMCLVLVGVFTGTAEATGGGRAVVGVPPTALSLVSRLTGLQIRDPDLVLFTATTPVPTYWQVASLSVLNGETWVPDAATEAALTGRPSAAPPGDHPPGRTFSVTVTVANLASRLLPVPPSTSTVTTADLTSVGVVAPAPSAPGEHYGATATVPTLTPSDATATTDLADTELPVIPAVVTTLARSITASASTPVGKAEALTNWFRSRLFHYSLQATPSTLVSFLTTSRTGSCEQFAGAFAVLARAVGLPTRVAIGFTTGVRDPAGQTVVRGMDAHAWPQVLLGGSWISFEPTPQLPSGELAPPGVIGITAVGNPNPISATTIPRSLPRPSLPLPAVAVAVAPTTKMSWWWVAFASGPVLLVLLMAGFIVRRRRRQTPGDQLLTAWRQVDLALEKYDVGRPPWRTPAAHTRVLRLRAPDGADADSFWTDLEWLATTVEEATYGATSADDDVAQRARQAGRRVTKAMSVGIGR